MLRTLVRTCLRNLSTAEIRRVRPVRYDEATGDTARIYRELERDFGVLAPPIALHAPAADVLAASWLMLRETLLVPAAAPRSHKEAVSAAVSEANSCPFCVGVHSSIVGDLVGLRNGEIADPSARSAAAWVTANTGPDTGKAHPVPFPPEQAAEMVGTAVILHYLNRMVNIFLTDAPMPPYAPPFMLRVVQPVLTWLITSAERDGPRPGVSLDLLPEAPLPENLRWAANNPTIAGAFARGAAALDRAADRSVSPAVRALVTDRLSSWDGGAPGVSRAWVEEDIAGLSDQDRPAGRLAFLTALASYQIDDSVIDEFRATHPEDRALIDLTSWASFAAACQAGTWLPTG